MEVENALIIDTADLDGRDLKVECVWDAGRFPLLGALIAADQVAFGAPVELSLVLKADRELVRAAGRVVTTVELDCGRCLERFGLLIDQTLDLVYQQAASITDSQQEEIELTAEQMDLIAFRGSRIDLRQAVAEQVLLAFPIKPLCNRRCKGLCPRCGMNLNNGPCDCPPREPAGPLAGLKVLLSGGRSD